MQGNKVNSRVFKNSFFSKLEFFTENSVTELALKRRIPLLKLIVSAPANAARGRLAGWKFQERIPSAPCLLKFAVSCHELVWNSTKAVTRLDDSGCGPKRHRNRLTRPRVRDDAEEINISAVPKFPR